MRKLFRRNRKKLAEEANVASPPIFVPPSSTPGSHVCTSLCDSIASLPPQFHESVIAQLSQNLGQTPDGFRITNFSLTNARVIPGATRDFGPEVDERRDIEGYIDFASLPLATVTTYRYPPLPKGHARFLRLGGSGAHPLAYLESHSLTDPPTYIAVSYCWDPNSAQRAMFLDLQSFSISETVLEVLNQVQASQHATGSKYLIWLDQICIAQDNPAEKRDQIYRMGAIYSRAEKVFIWLGPTATSSDTALAKMETMLDDVKEMNNATITRIEIPDNTVAVINADHGWTYGHLLSRQWFRRLWTVQEALLARKLVVMCGYREVDFDLFVELAYHLLIYGSLDLIWAIGVNKEDLDAAITGVVNLHALRSSNLAVNAAVEGYDLASFQSLVIESRSRNCTVTDDRVFALLGVAPRRIRQYMAAIQGKPSTWELYAYFAKFMLENDQEWFFLSLAPSKDRPRELPSWVPNLNSQQPFASKLAQASLGFSAGISSSTKHLIHRMVTLEKLVVRGFRLDVVSEIIQQNAFTEEKRHRTHTDICNNETHGWDQQCVQLCQRTFGLGPEQFPALHVFILLAQSTTQPAMDHRAVEAYHIFKNFCRFQNETHKMVHQHGFELPEKFRNIPNGAAKLVERSIKIWRNKFSEEEYGLLLDFTQTMASKCSGRPYISTHNGMLGLGCPGIKIGDVVCILYGTTVPYILRPSANGKMVFVGDAYIYNAMNGEMLKAAEKAPDELFQIV